jgi:hypothetical protein
MKIERKRFLLRWLRKLFDALEERLHAEEVTLRNDLSDREQVAEPVATCSAKPDAEDMPHQDKGRSGSETFSEWETRKSGVAVISKKEARRRRERVTAAAFDLRFAR